MDLRVHENSDEPIHRKDVLNAFRPDGEMQSPSGFAGRKKQVLQLVDALCIDGSCPIIFSERGLGKSSLANQILRIAIGDVELLGRLGEEPRALREKDRFTAFWVNCSNETNTKKDLFRRIINRAEGYSSVGAFDSRSVESVTSTDKISLKFVTSETKRTYTRKAFQDLDVEEQLLAVMDSLRDQGHKRQLVIIDELDRLNNTEGIAGFVKNHSDEDTKFMLVGIADSISALLEDHESLARHIHPVKMPPMANEELEEIVFNAMNQLNHSNGVAITFSSDALIALAKAARGFPWFVHLLGQDALIRAWEAHETTINASDIRQSVDGLAKNKFSQEFSDRYTRAVGESYQREVVLRIMARWGPQDVPLSESYRIAKKLGVANPSQHKRDLERRKYGEVLLAPQKGIVRFRNALFKRYVDLRHSIFMHAPKREKTLSSVGDQVFDATFASQTAK